MHQGEIKAGDEWQKRAEEQPTEILLDILASTKRKRGQLSPDMLENRQAIKAILEQRGLDSVTIARRSRKIARQKMGEPPPSPPDEPRARCPNRYSPGPRFSATVPLAP